MESNATRIQELTRLNRGRLAATAFLASLTSALDVEITQDDLLSLADTDTLTERYRSGYGSLETGHGGLRRFFSQSETSGLQHVLACAAEGLGSEQAVLLTAPGQDCGAVKVEAATALRATRAIVDIDGDALQLVSADGTNGILLDWNEDDEEQAFELAVWGPRWTPIVETCSHRG